MKRRTFMQALAALPIATQADALGETANLPTMTPVEKIGGAIPSSCDAGQVLSFQDQVKDFWEPYRVSERMRYARSDAVHVMDPDLVAAKSMSGTAKYRIMYDRALKRIEEREWMELLDRHGLKWCPIVRPLGKLLA